MGFSLFGRSGDNQTTQNTSNTTTDINVVDSGNQTYNWSQPINAAFTRNDSYIRNDSNVQNTALQLTDAFNRITTNNWANVGNVNVGGTAADDASKYVSLFGQFQNLQPKGLNNATPDLNTPLLDFTALSRIVTDNINASAGQARVVQDGFAKNTAATGNALGVATAGANSGLMKWGLIALGVIVVAWLYFRRKS